jgi:putative redox protein
MKKDTPNSYSNDEITVTYNPSACINAQLCARELSDVFRTSVIPWIKLDGITDVSTIVTQVKRCPSGALQCYLNKDQQNKKLAS